MTLPETGWSRDQIFAALTEMKAHDLATEGGAAFAYVYDSGERAAAALASQAYSMFLGANGLDPTAFPSLLRTAKNYILCNNDSVVTLPDGRDFYIPGGGPWPAIPGEEWWAEEVQTVAIKGAPMTIVNNSVAIEKKRVEWNLAHGWPHTPGDTESVPTEGGGTNSDAGSSGSDSSGQEGEGGCGCRSDGSDGSGGALGLGLAGLGLRGLRRRRR